MQFKSLQNNRYKIQAILGQGGYGITYLATQTMLGRQVAIKEFFMKDYCGRASGSPEVTLGTDGSREMVLRYREKFKKEAATLARLNHPNIVRVIDMFEENNTYYYVMEYADGPSLSQIIKARVKLPTDEALAMIKQVADAVSYLHQENLCHYDIKPANILTSKKGQVILADFGLAKQYDEQGEETSTTPVGKSKGFAPPEQYRVGGVSDFSPETDIYALAATLYKLLTGITPIESLSRDDEEIDFSILPAALITPIQKAMNLKRKERFHSMEEFMEAITLKEKSKAPDDDRTVLDNPIVVNTDNPQKGSRWARRFVVLPIQTIFFILVFGFAGQYFHSITADPYFNYMQVGVYTAHSVELNGLLWGSLIIAALPYLFLFSCNMGTKNPKLFRLFYLSNAYKEKSVTGMTVLYYVMSLLYYFQLAQIIYIDRMLQMTLYLSSFMLIIYILVGINWYRKQKANEN